MWAECWMVVLFLSLPWPPPLGLPAPLLDFPPPAMLLSLVARNHQPCVEQSVLSHRPIQSIAGAEIGGIKLGAQMQTPAAAAVTHIM